MALPETFTLEEVAKHLGVARELVEQEARAHGCCSEIRRRLLFTAPQVERLLQHLEVRPTQARLPSGALEVTMDCRPAPLPRKHWQTNSGGAEALAGPAPRSPATVNQRAGGVSDQFFFIWPGAESLASPSC